MTARRWLGFALSLLLFLFSSLAFLWISAREAMGTSPDYATVERLRKSPQWKDGHFENPLARVDGPPLRMLSHWFLDKPRHSVPDSALPVQARRRNDFDVPPSSGLRVTWLGHSTFLVELSGRIILVDPVFGQRASPLSFAGPKRWYAPPLPLDQLPNIDAILISHDHYDHLDLPTVKALMGQPISWFVPLGVGARLRAWGVDPRRVTELDWWESRKLGEIELVSTPARHFSGRGLDDQMKTLWCGWALLGGQHRVYYSGDTAFFGAFEEVGAKLGPFDITLVEVGAYDALWTDVHLGPEQAVMVHQMVRGNLYLPVHWGMFDLANHGWTEPMERSWVAAERAGVNLVTPVPGESVELGNPPVRRKWWPSLPWNPVEKDPVWSSSVDGLLTRFGVKR